MPISSNISFEKIEKTEFEPIPAGLYQVQITDISEKLKAPWGSPQGSDATEMYLTFEFTIIGEKAKGRKLWKDVRPVTPIPPDGGFKASWLYRIASATIGHWITQEEGLNWDVFKTNALIGRQVNIVVNQTPPKDGKSYNNITDVLPVDSQLEPLIVDNVVSEGEVPVDPLTIGSAFVEPDVTDVPF